MQTVHFGKILYPLPPKEIKSEPADWTLLSLSPPGQTSPFSSSEEEKVIISLLICSFWYFCHLFNVMYWSVTLPTEEWWIPRNKLYGKIKCSKVRSKLLKFGYFSVIISVKRGCWKITRTSPSWASTSRTPPRQTSPCQPPQSVLFSPPFLSQLSRPCSGPRGPGPPRC